MSSTVIEGVDYGPLAPLIGVWRGDSGMDVAPESDGVENNPYYETIEYIASGDVTNAEEEKLAIVRYLQIVSRKSNDKVFHNESGYLTWHSVSGAITKSLVIPRGVGVVAGGVATVSDDETILKFETSHERDIAESRFMREKATTTGFSHTLKVSGDRLSYSQTTGLSIYGSEFDHTDENTLTRQKDS